MTDEPRESERRMVTLWAFRWLSIFTPIRVLTHQRFILWQRNPLIPAWPALAGDLRPEVMTAAEHENRHRAGFEQPLDHFHFACNVLRSIEPESDEFRVCQFQRLRIVQRQHILNLTGHHQPADRA